MRLDQYLRASRLVLRRTLAQELCDAGAVTVNGAPAKPAREVRVGDLLTLRRRDRQLTVRVLEVPATKQVSKNQAGALYEIVEDVTLPPPPIPFIVSLPE